VGQLPKGQALAYATARCTKRGGRGYNVRQLPCGDIVQYTVGTKCAPPCSLNRPFPAFKSARDTGISEQFEAAQSLDNAGPDVNQSPTEFDVAGVRTRIQGSSIRR
jgi:hypothetical protein